MALVSICVLPNHVTFMTDTPDATSVRGSQIAKVLVIKPVLKVAGNIGGN